MNIKYLIEPIWELYHIDSKDEFQINNVDFNIKTAEYLKEQYSLDRRRNIYKSLQRAHNNQNYNFKSIMDEVPVVDVLNFTNEEIFNYLMQFKVFMVNDEFGLLIKN
jgi:hypothetical protein